MLPLRGGMSVSTYKNSKILIGYSSKSAAGATKNVNDGISQIYE